MLSMTGFGIARVAVPGAAGEWVEAQLATVNHRHSQIAIRCELRDVALEDSLRKILREGLVRGSVQLQVTVQQDTSSMLDRPALRSLWQSLASEAQALGAPLPTLEGLLGQLPRSARQLDDGLRTAIVDATEQALAECQTMRQREGQALPADLAERQQVLQQLHAEMAARAPQRLEAQRAALRARVQEVLVDGLDEASLSRECALLADRLDISEELTRLQHHLQRLDDMIRDQHPQAQGKGLEFLLQELGREVNTIGSKSADGPLTDLVLAAKTTLEQIREQAANIL